MRKQLSKREIEEFSEKISKYKIALTKKDRMEIIDEKFLSINNVTSFFLIDDEWIPTLRYILSNHILKTVTVDMGAVKFVVSGADIMRPGIVAWDDFAKDEIVSVIDEKNRKPLAVGKMLVSADELSSMKTGKAVKNLHWVGDDIWNSST